MTREEGKEFANALKNNYTIDFDKLPDFCDLVISALEKNESAEEWYKLLCEKWDSDKWIPVSERLPEDRYAVLVYCPEYKNTYCAYYENNQWWIFGSFVQLVPNAVVAWMPLPEPYKGGDS